MMRDVVSIAWNFTRTEIISVMLADVRGGEYILKAGDFDLLQSTNLKDKNGKDIYKGDVVNVYDQEIVPITDEGQGPVEDCNHIVKIEMRNGVFGFDIPKSDDGETGWYGLHYWNEEISNEGYEVIGNIYENPELLKV